MTTLLAVLANMNKSDAQNNIHSALDLAGDSDVYNCKNSSAKCC